MTFDDLQLIQQVGILRDMISKPLEELSYNECYPDLYPIARTDYVLDTNYGNLLPATSVVMDEWDELKTNTVVIEHLDGKLSE
jgi:hypothetical protein